MQCPNVFGIEVVKSFQRKVYTSITSSITSSITCLRLNPLQWCTEAKLQKACHCPVTLDLTIILFCVLDRMREVDLGSGRALLIKEHGEFTAMGHKCPHYGAPLVKGEIYIFSYEVAGRVGMGKFVPPEFDVCT